MSDDLLVHKEAEDGDQRADGLPHSERTFRRTKIFVITFSVLMILAVLSPIIENLRARPTDGFPLSHYPMFSARREETATVYYLAGFDDAGNRQLIRYNYAGTGGFNQVRRQIRRRVRRGEAKKMCEQVAARIVSRDRKQLAQVTSVQVVEGTYNLNDYFNGKQAPVEEKVHAVCRVGRKTQQPEDADTNNEEKEGGGENEATSES
ncbi:MAG: hypothetical protein M3371_00380 [Acidobacteriota bacterium]|nr:hypothetical protein [Acidobacteriota bacterium]